MESIALRRTSRHAVWTPAQAVTVRDFTLVGQRVIDASAEGCLLACERPVFLGDRVIVSFQVPTSGFWFDAEGEVVRIVAGRRPNDRGYSAGLRFRDFERKDQLALGVDLRELPRVTATRNTRAHVRAMCAASLPRPVS